MSQKNTSNILSRTMVILVVLLGSLSMHSIAWDLWQGETLSLMEMSIGIGILCVMIAGIIFVLVQRMQMRKTESFRREKW